MVSSVYECKTTTGSQYVLVMSFVRHGRAADDASVNQDPSERPTLGLLILLYSIKPASTNGETELLKGDPMIAMMPSENKWTVINCKSIVSLRERYAAKQHTIEAEGFDGTHEFLWVLPSLFVNPRMIET